MKPLGLIALLSVINPEPKAETLAQRKRRLWKSKIIGWAMANQKPFEQRMFLASMRGGPKEERAALERMEAIMKASNERATKRVIEDIISR